MQKIWYYLPQLKTGPALCNFAVKLFKGPRSDQFFTLTEQGVTRNEKKLVKENTCRTTRCYNAPHNYLTRLVNQNVDKIVREKTKKQLAYQQLYTCEQFIMLPVDYWGTAQFSVLY